MDQESLNAANTLLTIINEEIKQIYNEMYRGIHYVLLSVVLGVIGFYAGGGFALFIQLIAFFTIFRGLSYLLIGIKFNKDYKKIKKELEDIINENT